jgi:hypothetical protein
MNTHLKSASTFAYGSLRAFCDDARITVSDEQVSTDLGGEAAILNLKNGVYYGLDSVAARIWDLIHQPRSFRELRDILLGEYAIDVQRLESDLRNLLNQLADQGLVQIAE